LERTNIQVDSVIHFEPKNNLKRPTKSILNEKAELMLFSKTSNQQQQNMRGAPKPQVKVTSMNDLNGFYIVRMCSKLKQKSE